MGRAKVPPMAFILVALFFVRVPGLTGPRANPHPEVVTTTGETLASVYDGLPAKPSRVEMMERLQRAGKGLRPLKEEPPEPGGCSYCGFAPDLYQCWCEGMQGRLCRYDGGCYECGTEEYPQPCGCAFDFYCYTGTCCHE